MQSVRTQARVPFWIWGPIRPGSWPCEHLSFNLHRRFIWRTHSAPLPAEPPSSRVPRCWSRSGDDQDGGGECLPVPLAPKVILFVTWALWGVICLTMWRKPVSSEKHEDDSENFRKRKRSDCAFKLLYLASDGFRKSISSLLTAFLFSHSGSLLSQHQNQKKKKIQRSPLYLS